MTNAQVSELSIGHFYIIFNAKVNLDIGKEIIVFNLLSLKKNSL